MSWAWCGNLSSLQWFRTGNDAERFEKAYHLLNEQLTQEGFVVTNPSVVHDMNWILPSRSIGVVRAAWRRGRSNHEDVIALGLMRDEERFDYEAWVGTSEPNGLARLMSDLNRVNNALLHLMMAQIQQDTNRQLAKEYRNSVKEMLPLGVIPVAVDIGTGVTTFVPGLPMSLKDLLPWILTALIIITVTFFGFVGYYALMLARTEWKIRRAK